MNDEGARHSPPTHQPTTYTQQLLLSLLTALSTLSFKAKFYQLKKQKTDMTFDFYHNVELKYNKIFLNNGGTSFNSSNFLTLNTANKSVVWFAHGGSRIVKQFYLEKVPICAIFCKFGKGQNNNADLTTIQQERHAVAILVSSLELQICMFTGETYDIKLPHEMKSVVSVSFGLLLEKKGSTGSSITSYSLENLLNNLMPSSDHSAHCVKDRYYGLSDPSSVLFSVSQMDRLSTPLAFLPLDDDIVCSQDATLCSYSHFTGMLYRWQLSAAHTDPITVDVVSESVCNHSSENVFSEDIESALDALDGSTRLATLAPPIGDSVTTALMDLDTFPLPMEGEVEDRFFMKHGAVHKKRVSSGRTSLGSFTSPADARQHHGGDKHRDIALAFLGGGDDRRTSGSFGGLQPSRGPTPIDSSLRPYQLASKPSSLLSGAGFQAGKRQTRESSASARGNSSMLGHLAAHSPLAKMELSLDTSTGSARLSHHAMDLSMAAEGDCADIDFESGCLWHLKLVQTVQITPLHLLGNTECQFSISGSKEQLGGLQIHCMERKCGFLRVYSVSEQGIVAEPTMSHPCSSVAHLTVPLEDCSIPGDYQSKMLLANEQTHIPVTLLLRHCSGDNETPVVSVLLGGTLVGEAPLRWTDDMDDDPSADCIQCHARCSIATVQRGGTYLVVKSKTAQTVLSTARSLFTAPVSHNGMSLNVAADCAKVLMATVTAEAVGSQEKVLATFIALASKANNQITADCVAFVTLCAALSFPVEMCISAAQQHGVLPLSADEVCQVVAHQYSRFSDACKANATVRSVLFDSWHCVLQDYLLRFGDSCSATPQVESLQLSLTAVLALLTENDPTHSLLGKYAAYYLSPASGEAVTDHEVSSVAWQRRCIVRMDEYLKSRRQTTLTDADSCAMPAFNVPPSLSSTALFPCLTLRLTNSFYSNMFSHLRQMTAGCETDSVEWSKVVLGAAVQSYYRGGEGADQSALDWTTMVSYFPSALRLFLDLCADQCRGDPDPNWPDHLLSYLGRNDVCAARSSTHRHFLNQTFQTSTLVADQNNSAGLVSTADESATADGLAEVESNSQLRFTEDDRMHEVCRMLRSSSNIYLKLERSPEISEMDYRQKLQLKLLVFCRRSLANCVGRGMLTMCTLEPLIAEALPIPVLSITGRAAPTNTPVVLDALNSSPDLTLWPEFHNGVAAALRVGFATNSRDRAHGNINRVTRNWIIYNRTASRAKEGSESSHAGFLLGLGLQGHLASLSVTDICDYLVQGHEPTTISVLVGSAASKIGSADPMMSKTLCLHLPALLPAHHWDLEISPIVQSAALVGLGLLHCGSGHRVMTEFLLSELGRKPTSDRCESREALTLAASWALGMVLLGRGNKQLHSQLHGGDCYGDSFPSTGKKETAIPGLGDLHIEDRLLQHILGGKKPPSTSLFSTHSSAADTSARSSRVLEGSDINTDITAPGAIIALSMIYMGSKNADILGRLVIPSTVSALDAVRPDILMYLSLGRSLILWDAVEPSESWINNQVPAAVSSCLSPAKSASEEAKVDVNDLFAAYNKSYRRSAPTLEAKTACALQLNIASGCCWGIGLIFAGTADERAKAAIMSQLKHLQALRDNKLKGKLAVTVDKALRHTVEMCLCVVSLSLSCVMAGTGDLDCLRVLRELRFKVDDISYGTHMALSMAIGMLFLAGGNSSLRRDPLSTACLLISMCPRFPARSVDHQYHLQPLRHMYVLATEPRALHTIDVDSKRPVAVSVEVEMVSGEKRILHAPALLPELVTVRRIRVSEASQLGIEVNQPRYLPVSMSLAGSDSKEISTNSDGLGATGKFSETYSRHIYLQRHLPPLFVKRVPGRNYSETEDDYDDINSSLRQLSASLLSSQTHPAPLHLQQCGDTVQLSRRLRVSSLLVNGLAEKDGVTTLGMTDPLEQRVSSTLLRCQPFLGIALRGLAE